MQSATYFLALLVSYSGLIAGIAIAYSAKEELATGKRYFAMLQKALLAAVVAISLNHLGIPLALRKIAYALIILLLASKYELDSSIAYGILGAAFFLSRNTQDTFFVISALIFIYGLSTGSIAVEENLKDARKGKFGFCKITVRKGLANNISFIAAAALPGILF